MQRQPSAFARPPSSSRPRGTSGVDLARFGARVAGQWFEAHSSAADPMSCETSPTEDPACRSAWSVPDSNPDRDCGRPGSIGHTHAMLDETTATTNGRRSIILHCGVPAARLLEWNLAQVQNKQSRGAGNVGQAVKTPLAACKRFLKNGERAKIATTSFVQSRCGSNAERESQTQIPISWFRS